MIVIKTTLPKQEVTPEVRMAVARQLARFLPSFDSRNKAVPYALNGEDDAYVFDTGNDWWCRVYDDDCQSVVIHHREGVNRPGLEFAFANWVIHNRLGWTIVSMHQCRQTLLQDVTFTVEMPRALNQDEMCDISFEIDTAHIGVFLDGDIVPGARVTGYETGESAEAV